MNEKRGDNSSGQGWLLALGIGAIGLIKAPPQVKSGILDVIAALVESIMRPAPQQNALPPGDQTEPLALPQPSPDQEVVAGAITPVTVSDGELATRIDTSCVITIVGKRGSGKTLAAMRVMELKRWFRSCFVVGMPESARKLLPDWIGLAKSVGELPNGCIAVIDEAYMQFHSMERGGSISAERSRFLNLSRQRDQTLIFIAQDTRQLDRYVIQATDLFLVKEMNAIQVESERRELRDLFDHASEEMSRFSGDKREVVYAVNLASGYERLVRIEKPEFWSQSLSKAYGQNDLDPGSSSGSSIEKLAEAAKELRRQGLSYSKIAKALGISKTKAYYLENGYPVSR